jgi:hypothetical protein
MTFFEKVLNIKLLMDAKHNNDNNGYIVPELYTDQSDTGADLPRMSTTPAVNFPQVSTMQVVSNDKDYHTVYTLN